MKKDFDIERFPESESTKQMMSRISPIYENSYVGKWLFEVGGKGKTFKQIKDEPNSYIAYDDVEIGTGNKIPLWLFGFLY